MCKKPKQCARTYLGNVRPLLLLGVLAAENAPHHACQKWALRDGVQPHRGGLHKVQHAACVGAKDDVEHHIMHVQLRGRLDDHILGLLMGIHVSFFFR